MRVERLHAETVIDDDAVAVDAEPAGVYHPAAIGGAHRCRRARRDGTGQRPQVHAHAGRRLAGSTIPQAHPTGYPIYRLEWQSVGSLQRRLRQCQSGVRAEPYSYASDELTALELYLNQRAAGMIIETPAVRP